MSDDKPAFTPAELKAAKDSVVPPPVGTGPDAAELAAKAADGAYPNETDVTAVIAAMQAQMAAMAEQIKTLKAGDATGEHAIVGAAAQLRDLVAHHYEFHHKGPELVRLADDVLDASRNAVASGDTAPVRNVTSKLERALLRFGPRPGENHYYRQALGIVQVHIPDAADTITEATPSRAPALGSSTGPAKVLAGSVTG